MIFSFLSDSEAIRTLDPRLRRALLYPAELRNQPYVKRFLISECKDSAFIWLRQEFFALFLQKCFLYMF